MYAAVMKIFDLGAGKAVDRPRGVDLVDDNLIARPGLRQRNHVLKAQGSSLLGADGLLSLVVVLRLRRPRRLSWRLPQRRSAPRAGVMGGGPDCAARQGAEGAAGK